MDFFKGIKICGNNFIKILLTVVIVRQQQRKFWLSQTSKTAVVVLKVQSNFKKWNTKNGIASSKKEIQSAYQFHLVKQTAYIGNFLSVFFFTWLSFKRDFEKAPGALKTHSDQSKLSLIVHSKLHKLPLFQWFLAFSIFHTLLEYLIFTNH